MRYGVLDGRRGRGVAMVMMMTRVVIIETSPTLIFSTTQTTLEYWTSLEEGRGRVGERGGRERGGEKTLCVNTEHE